MALIYCKECGKQISSKAPVCPNCGSPQDDETNSDNNIHIGYLLISFLIPLVGFVLVFVFWTSNRKKANSSLIGAILGLVITAIIYSCTETMLESIYY